MSTTQTAKRQLITAIKARFTAKVPKVKTVRLFNNQFAKEKEEKAFAYPAVFIEFSNITYKSDALGTQKGDVTLRFHVGLASLKTEDEEIIDLVDDINEWFQGFSPTAELTTPFDRKAERQDTDHDGVIVWQIDYNFILIDNQATRQRHLVQANIDTLEVKPTPEGENPYFLKPNQD